MTTRSPKAVTLPPQVDWDGLTEGTHFVRLHGRKEPYLQLPGLLALAGQVGRIDSRFIQTPTQVDQGVWLAVYEVTLTLPDGTSQTAQGVGDASPGNVGASIASALPRMSATRALCRALRHVLLLGQTVAEEIPETSGQGQQGHQPWQPPQQRQPRQQGQNGQNGQHHQQQPQQRRQAPQRRQDEGACPSCGSGLWDNREQRANGSKRPAWKCKDWKCAWIQWDIDPTPAPGHQQQPPQGYDDRPPMDPDVPF